MAKTRKGRTFRKRTTKNRKRKIPFTSSGTMPTVKDGKIIYPKGTFGFRPYPKKK